MVKTNEDISFKILNLLRQDYRIPHTEIAKNLEISRNTVNSKIKELIQKEIITTFTIEVDPEWFFQKTLFLEIKTNPHEPWLADQLESLPECEFIDGIIGDYSLILKVRIIKNFSEILSRIDALMAKSSLKKYQIIDIIHTYKENGYRFQVSQSVQKNLDEKDKKLIEILQNQGNKALTHTQISQRLEQNGLPISQPAVFKRIKRLETDRIIEKFTITTDFSKIGLSTKLYVRIKVDPASYDRIAMDYLSTQDQIFDLYRTGENYGLLAIVRTKNIEGYNQFLQNLYTDSQILDTHTTLVLEERKKY
jgi:Lrp/AsnC family leucine-responsive transcriptional regulator